jgi:response regulator RpfG family c-di-GMP phosphodiesterase
VVAVADVYDALTSSRPYKPAWSEQEVLDYLRSQRGKHFDPALVDAFLGVHDEALRVQREFWDADPVEPESPAMADRILSFASAYAGSLA